MPLPSKEKVRRRCRAQIRKPGDDSRNQHPSRKKDGRRGRFRSFHSLFPIPLRMQIEGLTGGRESSVRRNVLCMLAVLACLCARGHSRTPELNEVVVTATRVDSPCSNPPASSRVITQKEIQESGAADLSRVLGRNRAESWSTTTEPGPGQDGEHPGIHLVARCWCSWTAIRLELQLRDGSVDLSRIPMENHRSHRDRARRGKLAVRDGRDRRSHQHHHEEGRKRRRQVEPDRHERQLHPPRGQRRVADSLTTSSVAGNPMDLLDGQNSRTFRSRGSWGASASAGAARLPGPQTGSRGTTLSSSMTGGG